MRVLLGSYLYAENVVRCQFWCGVFIKGALVLYRSVLCSDDVWGCNFFFEINLLERVSTVRNGAALRFSASAVVTCRSHGGSGNRFFKCDLFRCVRPRLVLLLGGNGVPRPPLKPRLCTHNLLWQGFPYIQPDSRHTVNFKTNYFEIINSRGLSGGATVTSKSALGATNSNFQARQISSRKLTF